MKTENKYLDFLNELHHVLKYTDKISLSNFTRSFKLSSETARQLVHGGLIKKLGNRPNAKYYWNTIAPSLPMALELEKRVKEAQKKYYEQNKKKVDKTSPDDKKIKKEKKVITGYVAKLGPFTIHIKPVYGIVQR